MFKKQIIAAFVLVAFMGMSNGCGKTIQPTEPTTDNAGKVTAQATSHTIKYTVTTNFTPVNGTYFKVRYMTNVGWTDVYSPTANWTKTLTGYTKTSGAVMIWPISTGQGSLSVSVDNILKASGAVTDAGFGRIDALNF